MKRNLSGIFIFDTDENGKRTPTCIEECSEETRFDYLHKQSKEWLEQCCIILCDTLRAIGDDLDISRE